MSITPSLASEFFGRIKQASNPFAFLAGLVNSSPPTFECDWLDFKVGDDPNITNKASLEEQQKKVWSKALSAAVVLDGYVRLFGFCHASTGTRV